MSTAIDEVKALLEIIENRRKFHKIDYYAPYEFQKKFHEIEGHETPGVNASQRALMCANQIGKTTCGALEVAYHATGLYPDWWEGHRFTEAVRCLCGSNTNEQTRDNLQAELCGDPTDDKLLGTGAIPKEMLGERIRKPGVPNAFDSIAVRHVSGGTSRVMFRAYEQGAKKHMGSRIDFGWMDEEPPQDIYSQYLRGTFATGGKLIITFTPEEGVTEVVHQFMTDLKKGQALVTATWDDAPHMTKEKREEFLAQIPAHEREMRTRGLPKMGSGLVFPIPDEEIMCDPFPLPDHWPRIIGMDFGWEHPAAAVWQAWDRDTDTTYVFHEFRQSKAITPVVASAVKNGSAPWIPVAWPHDGMIKDKQSGRPLADLYRAEGLNMLVKPFSNPPPPGQKDGSGGQGVEAGIMAMLTAMEEGRYKVFSSCREWFEEKGTYHRKDGQIVKLRDDLMSASRYGYQSRRFSSTKPVQHKATAHRRGMRTW